MQTKSGLKIEVSEMPGEMWIRAQGEKQIVAVFASSIKSMVDLKDVKCTETGGPKHWGISVTPKAGSTIGGGIRVGVIFTASEVQTFRGLLRSAAKYALHPPMVTYVELPLWLAERICAVRPLLGCEAAPVELRKRLDQLLLDLTHQTAMPMVGTLRRCMVSRKSLAALRAAKPVPTEQGHDMRWARQLCVQMGYEGCGPDAWEPCEPTDEYARLVVLP